MASSENNKGQGRESSVSGESQAAPSNQASGNQSSQGRSSSASAQTQDPPSQPKPEAQGRETPSSANPDHSGGKVESGQIQQDGTVAATEEEKGGSSD
ncbi:MAG: hypothetical protein ACKO7W_07930 [Elainella sp.]